MSSSRETLPCFASRTITAEVNCLATEPDSEIDSVVSGTPYSRFAMP
jgi:hypothetical protein